MSLATGILKIVGGVLIIALTTVAEVFSFGLATPAAVELYAIGGSLVASGIVGVINSKKTVPARGSAETNSVGSWNVIYGQVSTNGVKIYNYNWGNQTINNQPTEVMKDLVVVLASHECQSVDEVKFDNQFIQIDTNAVPTSAAAGYILPTLPAAGSGTSFTPVQETCNLASVVRSSFGVVSVTTASHKDIPYLQSGDRVLLQNIPGDATLNGIFPVAQIVNAPSSHIGGAQGNGTDLTFTILNGGTVADVISAGQVLTQWPNYGRQVYFEPLLGTQTQGQTFVGLTAGTPYLGTGKLVSVSSPWDAGGPSGTPSPWTFDCSLVGKTAAHLRLQYNTKFFTGLPQISFIVSGKNNIFDPRTNFFASATGGTGYIEGDVITVVQTGGSGCQLDVTAVDGSGAITATVVHADGSGYKAASGLATTGGTGTGATATVGFSGSYGYTNNAALCIADFLTTPLKYGGFGLAYGTDINTQALIDAANICDEPVDLAIGGTEKRYTCNGQFKLDEDRGKILQDLLSSCAGRLNFYNGQYFIEPAIWVAPLSPAVDLRAISAGRTEWAVTTKIKDLANAVRGTYVSPNNFWQVTDFPIYAQDHDHGYDPENTIPDWDGDENFKADGERRYMNIELPFTTSTATAQRLAKLALLKSRFYGSGVFGCTMAGYQYVPGDVLEVNHSNLPGFTNKQVEVLAVRLKPVEQEKAVTLMTELDLKETDESIFAWSVEEDLSPQGQQQSTFSNSNFIESTCYPYSPGYAVPLSGDAYEGAQATFGIQPAYAVDAQGNGSVSVAITGYQVANHLDEDITAPNYFITAGTGGSLAAGDYYVGVSARDASGSGYSVTDYHAIAPIEVPASGKINFTIEAGVGNASFDLYLARYNVDGQVFHFNKNVVGTATTANITTLDVSTTGGPDPIFDHYGVTYQQVIHSGPWSEQIQSLTSTTLTIFGAGMTLNQWAGYNLTLLAKYDGTVPVQVLNLPIASSTATIGGYFTLTIGANSLSNTLPDLTTLLAVGDLMAMNFNPTFTDNGFADPNIANGFYPSGASDTTIEPGHVVIVLASSNGAAGQVRTIQAVGDDDVSFDLSSPWAIKPADGDQIIICSANVTEVAGNPASATNNATSCVIAQPVIPNLQNLVWLFRIRTEDVKGNFGPDSVTPWRMLYLFSSGGTRVVSS